MENHPNKRILDTKKKEKETDEKPILQDLDSLSFLFHPAGD